MSRRVAFLIVFLTFVLTQIASAGLITSIERRNSSNTAPEIATGLGEDALAFVNILHQYNNLPDYLLGAEYIKVANSDKSGSSYELDVTLAGPAMLFIFLDNRIGNDALVSPPADYAGIAPDIVTAGMTWVTNLGFFDTGNDIGIDEGGDGTIDRYSSVYVRCCTADTVTLLAQNDGCSRNMYGVAVIPEPATLILLGLGGVSLLRRRKA